MVHTVVPPAPTLAEWLSAHARAVRPRRLALYVASGALLATIVVLWRPTGWPALVGAGLCGAAFGTWGFAERHLPADPFVGTAAHHARASGWRVLRAIAAVVGTLAAALVLFGVLFGVLGTWIS